MAGNKRGEKGQILVSGQEVHYGNEFEPGIHQPGKNRGEGCDGLRLIDAFWRARAVTIVQENHRPGHGPL